MALELQTAFGEPMWRLFMALGMGALIGIERERRKGDGASRSPAGLRTFALIGLAGGLAAQSQSEILIFVTGIFVASAALAGYWLGDRRDPGLTTEVAMFATFLLGMFTKRSNGVGSFWGLVIGTSAAVTFHGLSFATGNPAGVKGGWINQMIEYPKEMSQNFWIAIVAFSVTFVVNALLSLVTPRTKSDEELKGLVYSLTPKHRDENEPWLLRPAVLGSFVMVAVIVLNYIFW